MMDGSAQFELLKEKYVKFHTIQLETHGYFIIGDIDLIDPDNGIIWETYTVKIEVTDNFPLPIVYEVSNKIPKESDRHINGDGSCCLSPYVEQALILGNDYTLIDYIDKLVIPFLAAQKLFDLGQGWINGEYSHQIEGILEYYQEKLKTKKLEIIIECLRYVTDRSTKTSEDLCLCESGRRFEECHKVLSEQFALVNPILLNDDIIWLEQHSKYT